MLKKKLLQQTSIRLNNTINKNTIASFKILQMSIRELYEFSKNEKEKNPLLSTIIKFSSYCSRKKE